MPSVKCTCFMLETPLCMFRSTSLQARSSTDPPGVLIKNDPSTIETLQKNKYRGHARRHLQGAPYVCQSSVLRMIVITVVHSWCVSITLSWQARISITKAYKKATADKLDWALQKLDGYDATLSTVEADLTTMLMDTDAARTHVYVNSRFLYTTRVCVNSWFLYGVYCSPGVEARRPQSAQARRQHEHEGGWRGVQGESTYCV